MAEDAPFRFLSDEEFLALAITDRAIYLSRASQELEMRQKLLREHLAILKKDAGKD
jgi:hypothetical protein